MKFKPETEQKLGRIVHRRLVPVAGLLFCIVGGAKVVGVFGIAGILETPDPVFGLPWRVVLAGAGIVEAACLFLTDVGLRVRALL